MRTFTITACPGLYEWRLFARQALQESLNPSEIIWQNNEAAQNLFSSCINEAKINQRFFVPKEFLDAATIAICHSEPERFALLYRILWRLCHENRNLLHLKTDNDVLKLNSIVKAVRRDAYKIKAFLRFREIKQESRSHFIAWYEPEHYSLELSLPFFQVRFKNMNWSILTPYLGANWDGKNLLMHASPDSSQFPKEDEIERYWLKYYASTFNPARPKKQAMLNQMPKKYWKNMPETVLIQDMMQNSGIRMQKMIETK